MARPAPADFKSDSEAARSSRFEDSKSPFAYDRRLADSSRSGIPGRASEREALQAFDTEERGFAPSRKRLTWLWIAVVALFLLAGAGLGVAGFLWARTRESTADR